MDYCFDDIQIEEIAEFDFAEMELEDLFGDDEDDLQQFDVNQYSNNQNY